MIERTQDGFSSRTHDTCAANDWLVSLPRWEPRVAAEAFLTRTGEEAAENSRTRRDQLAVWRGVFGTEFDWVTPPVLNSQTRVAVEMCPASGVLRVMGLEQPEVSELPRPVTLNEVSRQALQ